MKKAFFMIVFVAISVLCFSSCQADEAPDNQNQGESVVEMTPLADVLTRAVESHKPGDPATYIIYVAATDEFTLFSEEDYSLFSAFAGVIVHDDSSATRAPQGSGWTLAGTGKGKLAAMQMATELAGKLEKNRDFEIHVEYGDDGSFTIWYRYVK